MRDALIFGVFGLSLHYLFGKAGLLSLGHATFFGIGAYCTAILGGGVGGATRGATFNLDPSYASVLGLITGTLFAGAVALLIGYFLIFAGIRREYFAIMMLAFCLICTQIVISWFTVTGGDQGLTRVPPLTLSLLGVGYRFESNLSMYFLALMLAITSLLGLWFSCRGDYGRILTAITNNEFRARTLGHNTNLHLLIAFTIAAMIAALAGGIYTACQGYVTWEFVSLFLSIEVVVWLFVGGWRNILGPFVGAFFVLELQREISSISATLWPLALGLLFISSVYLFPEGLLTLAHQIFNRFKHSLNSRARTR
jgi:branched-chain amino acid transport system permease protein